MVTLMNRLFICALTAAMGGSFCSGAVAQVSLVDRNTVVHVAPRTQFVSTYQYKAAKERIAAEFQSAKEKCDGLPTDARDVCIAEAGASEKAAAAELEARHEYTREAYRKARVLGTDSPYWQARHKCRGLTRTVRNRCLNEVQASYGMS